MKALLTVLFCSLTLFYANAEQERKRSYPQPASTNNEAFLLTGDRINALVFGGIQEERIQFGDKSAHSIGTNQNVALGTLLLQFKNHDHPSDYNREIDPATAVARVNYRVVEVSYRREAFVSAPEEVIVVRIITDHQGPLSLSLRFDPSPSGSVAAVTGTNTVSFNGRLKTDSVRFNASARVIASGGKVRVTTDSIEVEHADSALLFLAVTSGLNNFLDRPNRLTRRSLQALDSVSEKNFETLLAEHVANLEKR